MNDPIQSDALELRHKLPSGLIHDLRSPLNQIIGYSEMLMEQAQESGNVGQTPDLEKVRAAGHRLLTLIETNLVATEGVSGAPQALLIAPPDSPTAPDLQLLSSGVSQGLILVVDDDLSNLDMLSRRLEFQGHEVARARSGQEALDMMHARVFDLVLLDIMMPDMDGYEVLAKLKADELLQHVPVIVISALNELNAVVRCIEMGAADHLSKPIDSTRLKARISACLDKKRGHDREALLFDQLRQSHERLQALERQREDLTRMVVHDLRTPLTSVIAAMQTMEMVGDLNPLQKEVVDIAISGSGALLSMINDLLDFEKMESSDMKLDYSALSVADLIASAVAQVAPLAEQKQLKLLQKIAADLPPFEGDEDKLRRTLVNLLGNAIKFTPPGGHVTVEAYRSQEGNSVEFSVQDNGEGIPEEAFGRIFEKFGQVESRQGGRTMSTGLGLTFCKLAIESHGGHIRVESEPGQGSTFSFTVPLPLMDKA